MIIHLSSFASDDRNIVLSQLKSVTVYRSGAELTHSAFAELKKGNNELVIDNISNTIDINSIQIKSASAVTVMGIEFSNNYLVSTEKSVHSKFLQDSLEHIQRESKKINDAIINANDLIEVLKANRDIKGSQNGLSVAELIKLMDYYKIKLQELQTEISQLQERKKKTDETIVALKNQLQEEQRKNVSTAGRLILQLSVAITGKYDFLISYIAQNAYWKPFYDIRVDDIKNPMKIICRAKITQTTGIDWKQVKLSLSTSSPSQWGNAPTIQSWYLGYINPVNAMNNALRLRGAASLEKSLQGKVAGLDMANSLDEVVVTGYGARKAAEISYETDKKISTPIYVVNGNIISDYDYQKINPSAIKKITTLKSSQATALYGAHAEAGAIVVELKDGLQDYISVADNTLDLSFDIDIPYDIPSNGKEQSAVLQTLDVNTLYQHYSIPKIDKDAYLVAQIPQWSKLNLLAGEANIILEGTYVGKSFIDPNSISDTLSLTMGRDKRVSIKREKILDFSSVKFLGNNKLQKFTYEITIKNNKKENIELILKDQFPLSTTKEIEVELIESNSADVNTDTGILNWKINLAGSESKKVRFTYTVKYPKDKVLNWN